MKKIFKSLSLFLLLFLFSCEKSFVVTIDNDNNTDLIKIDIKKDGTLPSLDEPTKEGYKFTSYYYNDKPFELNTLITKSITLKAHYDLLNYIITYNLDGGTNSNSNPNKYTIESDTITLQPATKEGYEFLGWYNGETKVETIVKGSKGNMELNASFKKVVFQINYNIYGENEVNDPIEEETLKSLIKEFNIKKIIALPILNDRLSSTFEGWYLDKEYKNKVTDTSTFDKDTTLYGKWKTKTYKVKLYLDFELKNFYNEIEVEHSSTIDFSKIESLSKEGHTFKGWQYYDGINDIYIDIDENTIINSDLNLYPIWD